MEHRLKVRLTGAAILVALVVLLVPEMFRGERNRGATPSAGAADGPPVRAYTIELNGRSATPLQNASAPTSTGPTSAEGLAAPTSPAASTPSPPPASAPPAAETRTAESAPPVQPAPSAPAAASKPAPAAMPSANREGSAGRWTVQLGLFAKHENAERLVKEAEAKGFTVEVSSPDSHGLYRVHTAATGDRARAVALQQQLKAQGFAANVMAP
jgi:cell division septation protein DedD